MLRIILFTLVAKMLLLTHAHDVEIVCENIMPRKKKSKSVKRLTDFVPGKLYRNFREITVWSYPPRASAQYYQQWSIFLFVELQATRGGILSWMFLDDSGNKIRLATHNLESLREAREPIKNPKNI